MSIKERILICQMIEKMEKLKEYSKLLGLENKSSFRGVKVNGGKQ